MRIVIRMPNWLGDFIMALPLCEDIKCHHPDSNLTLLAPASFLDLSKNNPFVDQRLSFCRKPLKDPFDIGILTTNSFSSAWHFFRSNIKQRIGFRGDRRDLLLTRGISFPKERGSEHLVMTYKRLLAPLNIPLSKTSPNIYLQNHEAEHFYKNLDLPIKRPLIGLHPLAAYGPAKCWPQEYFQTVMRHFIETTPAHFLLFGSNEEITKLEELRGPLSNERIHILAGRTSLLELAYVMQQCDLIVSNDSGPMHIAASLKRPLIALFGSTEPVVTAPYEHGTVLQYPTFCSPCFKRVCPIDFRCMRKLAPSYVIQEMERQLKIPTSSSYNILTC